jgi:hypothetical protein
MRLNEAGSTTDTAEQCSVSKDFDLSSSGTADAATSTAGAGDLVNGGQELRNI